LFLSLSVPLNKQSKLHTNLIARDKDLNGTQNSEEKNSNVL
jgi:hypothetical protein